MGARVSDQGQALGQGWGGSEAHRHTCGNLQKLHTLRDRRWVRVIEGHARRDQQTSGNLPRVCFACSKRLPAVQFTGGSADRKHSWVWVLGEDYQGQSLPVNNLTSTACRDLQTWYCMACVGASTTNTKTHMQSSAVGLFICILIQNEARKHQKPFAPVATTVNGATWQGGGSGYTQSL